MLVTRVNDDAREQERVRREWRWLGLALVGGPLLGGLIAWAITYATGDDSGALSRGSWAIIMAVLGAIIGAIAGFMLWALWVLSHSLARRLSHRR